MNLQEKKNNWTYGVLDFGSSKPSYSSYEKFDQVPSMYQAALENFVSIAKTDRRLIGWFEGSWKFTLFNKNTSLTETEVIEASKGKTTKTSAKPEVVRDSLDDVSEMTKDFVNEYHKGGK